MQEATTESLFIALERRGGLTGVRQRQKGSRRGDVSIAVTLDIGGEPVLYDFSLGGRGGAGFAVRQEILKRPGRRAGFVRKGRYLVTERRNGVKVTVDPETLALPLLAGYTQLWANALEALRGLRTYVLWPDSIRREAEITEERWLNRDGSNAPNVVGDLQRTGRGRASLEWIAQHLAAIAPGILQVEAATARQRRYVRLLQHMEEGHQEWFEGSQVSEGTLRALGVLLGLRQVSRPSLVAFDEIEDSIHPAALAVLLDAIEASLDRCNVVITSHSPEALTHRAATGERVRVLQWEDGTSRIYKLNDDTIASLDPPLSVGELLRTNALWPSERPCTVRAGFFEPEP
jgi:hypothetical protein